MSNSKISALTGATTPLAGTEVLPIVQSSTTKQVSIANLTAGRTQTSNGIVQGTAATGYNFTANTPASGMTSQLLNWYEEGTWTATLTASVTAPTTPVTTSGTYTRVGRAVTIQAYFAGVDTTGSAGDLTVTGLPFTVGSVRCAATIIMAGFGIVPAAGVMLGTSVYVANMVTATAIPMVAGNGKYLYVTATYQV
ncbi:MAG: hypothetical protein WCO04_18385 [Pseudomonadota bacterium]